MARCRSEGELGRARHRNEQLEHIFWFLAESAYFSQLFAAPGQFAGWSEVETYCLALEGLPSERAHEGITRAGQHDG